MDSYQKDPPQDEHIRSLLVSQGMGQNDVIRYKCVGKHMMQLTSNRRFQFPTMSLPYINKSHKIRAMSDQC